jgi:putative polyhydroxyalkanoate system protein
MAEISIRRPHQLGLDAARSLTDHWISEGQHRFGLTCELTRTASTDVVKFSRTGVSGVLTASATHFELQAKLGFLLSAYQGRVTTEIERQLDAALAPPNAS